MQLTVFIRGVGFLKNGDEVSSALMQIGIITAVHGVDLKTDNTKIFAGQPAGCTNILYVAHSRAFPGQDQDFFQPLSGNSLHFRFYFSGSKLGAFDIVVAVKAAVDAVIFAVVGDIKRGEQIDGITEMFTCFCLCPLCQLFQKWCCGRREQCGECFRRQVILKQGLFHVVRRINSFVVSCTGGQHLFHNS